MTGYILDTHIIIHDRKIRCKVTGAPGSANDGAPFILEINGGPGQGMSSKTSDYFSHDQNGAAAFHWILFDSLGCGESDAADHPDTEYTVDHFTEIAASVVEGVAKQLQLKQINLRVVGGSFGGLIALNMPSIRPQWTNPKSPIRLQAIFPFMAPLGMKDCMSKEFLLTHYANDPRLPDYEYALNRILAGDVKDRNDFISNVIARISFIYGKAYDTLFFKTCLAILKKFPNSLKNFLKALSHIKRFRNFAVSSYDFLYNFSFEVNNAFFASKFGGFELEDKFKNNPELREVYKKVIIFAAYGANDICTSGEKSLLRLKAMLPETGTYLHPGSHHDHYDRVFPLMKYFVAGDIVNFILLTRLGMINGENFVINLPETFVARYQECFRKSPQPSSTQLMFESLGGKDKEDKIESTTPVPIADSNDVKDVIESVADTQLNRTPSPAH
jgi:pimeloyl-ACP methyl ester carboxylesterase